MRDTDLFADVVFRDADVPFEDLLDWLFRWAEELRAAEDFALERSLEDVFDLLAVGAVPESGRPFDAR